LAYLFAKIEKAEKMEKSIESSNSIGATNKNFLLPSGAQLLLYVLVAFLLLITLNIGRAWDYLNKIVLKPQGGLDSIIATNAPGFHKILNSLSQSIILQVTFWVFVGCVVYVIIWFVKNIAINLLNDITADQYVHPTTYKSYRFWGSILARRIFFWISAIILVFYLIASIRVIVYLGSLCYKFIVDFHSVRSSLQLLAALAAVTGLIYILVLIVHITVNSWRLMYKDL
jgi:hypothetical protein